MPNQDSDTVHSEAGTLQRHSFTDMLGNLLSGVDLYTTSSFDVDNAAMPYISFRTIGYEFAYRPQS